MTMKVYSGRFSHGEMVAGKKGPVFRQGQGSPTPQFGQKLYISRIQHEDGQPVTSLNGDVQTHGQLEKVLNEPLGPNHSPNPLQARLAQLVDDYTPGSHVEVTTHPVMDPDYSRFVPLRMDSFVLTGRHAKPFETVTPRFNQLMRQVFDLSRSIDPEEEAKISAELNQLSAQVAPWVEEVLAMPQEAKTLQVTVREYVPHPSVPLYTDVELKGLDLVG